MDATSSKPLAPANRLRCVIIEDHRMFLDLVTTMLHAAPGLAIDVVSGATTVAEGIMSCDRFKPDIVLLDVSLPDGSGVTVAEHLVANHPHSRIVFLTGQSSMFACPETILRSAYAIVRKAEAFDALQLILSELSEVGPRSTTVAAAPPRNMSLDQSVRLLTQRERDILALVGASLTCEEISHKLGISALTVQTHRKNIAAKLGVPGRKLPALAARFHDQLIPRP